MICGVLLLCCFDFDLGFGFLVSFVVCWSGCLLGFPCLMPGVGYYVWTLGYFLWGWNEADDWFG